MILALSEDPQSTRAWARGAVGEELLAKRLEDLPPSAHALHDRRIPRSRANIDHIVVSPGGVWVIDAKRYKGSRPSREGIGGVFGPRVHTLRIGGRDGTKLVDGVRKQVALVADALDTGVPVAGVLCFLEADWGLFGSPFSVSEVLVTWPVRLVKHIAETADREVDVGAVMARLAAAFPPA
ncbi:NERD domain-containing protein [Microbacterium sp. Au-Mic1]|uniref:nuclease-related domain-containing protein n=1 Tax=Microbacterium sp. Au-Mic1 TaxID=2906457 RepID=UPI001E2E5520|nr:nuclease-related domain-containing protein [Microbacterium sp. Au-Mic1]MCE4026187.1 NERD domain-containing protein [Microbacterium sp. Au-Mic1]